MSEERNEVTGAEDRCISLRTYLHDHTAGAEQAVQLLGALSENHSGTALAVFANDLLPQIEQDLRVLEDIARRFQGIFQIKQVAGWLAEKLIRLKLSPLASAFNTFETLEYLSLGILGKRALWQTLQVVSGQHAELQELDFSTLIARAEAQYETANAVRLQLARIAFE